MNAKEISIHSKLDICRDGKTLVFIYGDFNILHPGHFRFINFAAEQGDILVVGLNDLHSSESAFLPNDERLDAISSLGVVDHIILINNNLYDLIDQLKPDVVVRGKEWKNEDNEEHDRIRAAGAQLLFSSGERFSMSPNLLKEVIHDINVVQDDFVTRYCLRHGINQKETEAFFSKVSELNVAVFGDLIVDEYCNCLPVGMSQEDPTIVVTPQSSNFFLGGAGIVAAHAKSLGAMVDFYSVSGKDCAQTFANETISTYGVKPYVIEDQSRPTTLKKRYRASGKTLLRVNDFSEQELPENLETKILKDFKQNIDKYDLVIFSDFNYGFLSHGTVRKLTKLCQSHQIPYVADSQSSSQVGDLRKFQNSLLVTPTEYEARLTVKNSQDGLVLIAEQVGSVLEAQNIFVTLAEDGVLIRSRSENGKWVTDELPALNSTAIDPAGAGDAMLTTASLALGLKTDIWTAALLGSMASAVQVSRVGNKPLDIEDIRHLAAKLVPFDQGSNS
jgi:rfaE bifunctional protein kinase chain/domain